MPIEESSSAVAVAALPADAQAATPDAQAVTESLETTAAGYPSAETGPDAEFPVLSADAVSAFLEQNPDLLYERLSTQDVDEIIRRNPKLQSRIGRISEREARKLAEKEVAAFQAQLADQERQARAKWEREEERRLAATDPEELARRRVQAIDADETREAEAVRQNQVVGHLERQAAEFNGNVLRELDDVLASPMVQAWYAELPRDEQLKLHHGSQTGNNRMRKFVEGLMTAHAERTVQARAEELAAGRLDAMLKERGLDHLRSVAREGADLGRNGGVPGGRRYTIRDLNMVGEAGGMSLDEYRRVKPLIDAQLARDGGLPAG